MSHQGKGGIDTANKPKSIFIAKTKGTFQN